MKKKQETIITALGETFIMSMIIAFISTPLVMEEWTLVEFIKQYIIGTFSWFFLIVIATLVGEGLLALGEKSLALIKYLKKKTKL